MRKARKFLAILLTILTLISSMPMSVFADEIDTPEDPPIVVEIQQDGETAEPEDVPVNGTSPPVEVSDLIDGDTSSEMTAPSTVTQNDTPAESEQFPSETSAPTDAPTESPDAAAEPAFNTAPSDTAEPTATSAPDSSEVPAATTAPEPESTDTPEASAAPDASASPESTEEPILDASATPEASTSPEPSEEPTPEASATPEASSTPEPTATPVPVEDPYEYENVVIEDEITADSDFAWPLPYFYTFSQKYSIGHQAWDIPANTGAPVVAVADGTVITTQTWNGIVTQGDNNSYGNMVEIQHDDGRVTLYAHLSKINVKVGDKVTRAQQIGRVGSTGNSTGPHLHFEVIENGVKVNPGVFGFYEAGVTTADEETPTVTSTEEYILEHANPGYVGTAEKAVPHDILYLGLTMADYNAFGHNPTLDELWVVDADEDGIPDNWEASLGQHESYAVLYELSEDSAYYVAKADTMSSSDLQISDWLAGSSHVGEGIVYDDVVFDPATGLAYVPKSYCTVPEEGAAGFGKVRLQILYAVRKADDLADVQTNVEVNINDAEGETISTTTGAGSVLSSDVTVQLNRSTDVKAVYVNGVELDSDEYSYNRSSGTIQIDQSAAIIDTIDIDTSVFSPESNGIMTVSALDDAEIKSHMGQLNSLSGTFKFTDVPVAGSVYIIPATTYYYTAASGKQEKGTDGYVKPMSDNRQPLGVEDLEDLLKWILNNTWKDNAGTQFNGFSTRTAIERMAQIPSSEDVKSNVGGFIVPVKASEISRLNGTPTAAELVEWTANNVDLLCSHIGLSASFDDWSDNSMQHNQGIDESSGKVSDYTDANGRIMVRVLYTDEETHTSVIGLAVSNAHTQSGVGLFAMTWEKIATSVKVNLTKTSANASYTTGNKEYSLEGAEYGVYTTQEAAQAGLEDGDTFVGKFTTDASGHADLMLEPEKYFVRELKAPKGFVPDTTVHEFIVTKEGDTLSVEDDPAFVDISLKKQTTALYQWYLSPKEN